MLLYIVCFMCTDNSVPLLKNLYENVTPLYAADWYEIGILLGLPSGELKAIKAGNPTDTKWCCNNMLEKWVDVDPSASWRKMFDALQSPAVSGSYSSDGKTIL